MLLVRLTMQKVFVEGSGETRENENDFFAIQEKKLLEVHYIKKKAFNYAG